jgi:hypothetical protein
MVTTRNGKLIPESTRSLQHDQRAPIEELSPIKRRALVACLQGDGVLYRRFGKWIPYAGSYEDCVSGITVADLSRDGLLAISTFHKHASARLTARGMWFAQTVADHLASDVAEVTDT